MILDDELAVLSLRTAQSIDIHLAGDQMDKSVLLRFGEKLSAAAGTNEDVLQSPLYQCPRTTDIFHQALEGSSSERFENLGELRAALSRVIAHLCEPESMNFDDIKRLKQFSLAFHRTQLANRLSRTQPLLW